MTWNKPETSQRSNWDTLYIIHTIKAPTFLELEAISPKAIYHHFTRKSWTNQLRMKGDIMNSEAFDIVSLWWSCDGVDVIR